MNQGFGLNSAISVTMKNYHNYFLVHIKGDSMYPVINNGELILCEKKESYRVGDGVMGTVQHPLHLPFADVGILAQPQHVTVVNHSVTSRKIVTSVTCRLPFYREFVNVDLLRDGVAEIV